MEYALLRRESRPDISIDEREDLDHDDRTGGRIRCPRCEWQPNADALWYCDDCPVPEGFLGGCGTSWNTFETGGVCPGCRYRWHWTSCHACGTWSPHEDWYQADDE